MINDNRKAITDDDPQNATEPTSWEVSASLAHTESAAQQHARETRQYIISALTDGKGGDAVNVKLSPEVEQALSRAKSAIETHQKVKSQIEGALRLQSTPTPRPTLQTVADNDSNAVPPEHGSEPVPAPPQAEGNGLNFAASLAVRIRELQKDLVNREDDILDASVDLREAWDNFNVMVEEDYSLKFATAADQYLDVVREGIGLCAWFGEPLPHLCNISPVNPLNSKMFLVPPLTKNGRWAKSNKTVYGPESAAVNTLMTIQRIESQIAHDRRERIG
jgi:hypothetical protein